MAGVTQRRESLLRDVADRFGYDLSLLLLADSKDDDLCLLCAHAYARNGSVLNELQDKVRCIANGARTQVTDTLLKRHASELIGELGLEALLPGAQFSYDVLNADCAPFDYECEPGGAKRIGVLVTAGANVSRLPETELDRIATEISIGRFERFISTVLRAQNDVSATNGSLDDTLLKASKAFANEIGAAGFLYRNNNKDAEWAQHWLREGRGDPMPAAPPEGQSLGTASKGEDPDLVLTRRPADGATLEVTLSQRSYRIVNLPFGRADTLARSLRDVRSQAIGISFQQKRSAGYLQGRFSETDERVAAAIYNNLQNFTQLKLADESNEHVFAILHGKALSIEGSASDIFSSIRDLSSLIKNVYVLSIGRLENEIEIKVESADKSDRISSAYLNRLRAKYLDRFYHGDILPDYETLAMGMDSNNNHYYVEAHMPREFADSRVYVVSFNGPYVAQATLHSLINIFTELFTRIKNEDFRAARSNVLTETRHAVFHHFAAAINWMATIKADWNMGTRHREHWARLREDPEFPEGIDWANWSLQQANLILENGRFLTKEIDRKAISRKPINVSQILQDCLRALSIEARRKSVKVTTKLHGDARAVATGDEVLMRIALMNLLDNAIKYSLNHGTVSCDVIYKSKTYEVRITNRGDPIPEKQFRRLLQIGARGKQRDHLNLRPGTGLGLPVTHRILRAHSETASLELQSTNNNMTFGGASNTFHFEMPYLTGLSKATPHFQDSNDEDS
ncbi:MAG: sensor histidine kinase [Sphingosinicella sp.]|uniref:sensor histidine kinase n=1 Tax=Sphingosinicella sp. TaxID=1917971 RepID=UPI004037D0B4